MTRIIWTGETRVVPGHGLAVHGQHLLLPAMKAASFVAQGLAEPDSPPEKAIRKTKQESES